MKTDDGLLLLLYGWRHHPDPNVRERLGRAIDAWVTEHDPGVAAEEAAQALASCRGTALEPFILTEDDRTLAVTLIRLALSNRLARPGIRVVSRDSFGLEGGLLIGPGLRVAYGERYALGQPVDAPPGTWIVRPGQMPRPEAIAGQAWRALSGMVSISEHGYTVRVDVGTSDVDSAAVERRSRVVDGPGSLQELGIRVTGRRPLVLETGSPESMLRLAALMADGGVLLIHLDATQGPHLAIQLALPEDDAVALKVVSRHMLPELGRWLELEGVMAPELPLEDRLALARWLCPAERWITDELMKVA